MDQDWKKLFERHVVLEDWRRPSPADQRASTRVTWGGDVQVRVGKYSFDCRGVDLSASGLLVEGTWDASLGSEVSVSFEVDGRSVHGAGKVVRVGPDGEWALQFEGLEGAAAESICSFVYASNADGEPTAATEESEASEFDELPAWGLVQPSTPAGGSDDFSLDIDKCLIRPAFGPSC